MEKNMVMEKQQQNEITPEGKKNIYALSSAAFFNDTGSDMLTPAYSTFLTTVLLVPQWIIGLIDSLSRLFGALIGPVGGKLSDRWSRKSFIWIGYIALMISRGTQALATFWAHLIPTKVVYEFGRAIRNPAREAMITEDIPLKRRGWAFGLLQTADSTGAILGPTIGYLIWVILREVYNWDIGTICRTIIAIAAAPTIISVIIVLIFVKDQKMKKEIAIDANNILQTQNNKKEDKSTENHDFNKKAFIYLIIVVTILSLVIPSETLMLSLAQERYSYEGESMFVLFFFFNLFYALIAYPAGVATDRFGARTVFIISTTFLGLYGFTSIFNFNGELFFTIVNVVIFGIFLGSIFPPMMKLATQNLPKNRCAEFIGIFRMFKTSAEIVAPLLLGGLFSAGVFIQYIPFIIICAISLIAITMMIFAPKALRI